MTPDFSHPAFAPYRTLIDRLGLSHGLPALATLNAHAAAAGLTQACGLPLRFIAPAGKLAARDYETHILNTGDIPTRIDTWHDVLNALVWLRFPRFKAQLNAAHGRAMQAETDTQRGRRRDALTVLDESGVWISGPDDTLFERIAAHDWHTLFWLHRAAVLTRLRFVVVGHALLEKALAPYPAMTGKCLWLGDAPDAESETLACAALPNLTTPRQLAPLPIQGIPGWDPANACAAYYDNPEVFRPARIRAGDTTA